MQKVTLSSVPFSRPRSGVSVARGTLGDWLRHAADVWKVESSQHLP
jgi:hypothetical protein